MIADSHQHFWRAGLRPFVEHVFTVFGVDTGATAEVFGENAVRCHDLGRSA